jgi:hypothetical protein
MLCYVMLCYVMLCYVMLCYVMLCYVMYSSCLKPFIMETKFVLLGSDLRICLILEEWYLISFD